MDQPHGFKCHIQALEVDQQCFVAFPFQWVHESGRIGDGLDHGICERWKNFLDLDFHEKNISKYTMWTIGFCGPNVCTTFFHGEQISSMMIS